MAREFHNFQTIGEICIEKKSTILFPVNTFARQNKIQFDIWGDTVNTASRMESNAEPGKINVSEELYLAVKDRFTLSYRGEIEAKGKGKMKMYLLEE